MKICVINFSGNVGKSLVCAQLLQPRMNAPVISVESLNVDASADGADVEQIRAAQFADIQRRVVLSDSIIVDVGASNVEQFLKLMVSAKGAYEDYDLWIVPAVRPRKQQMDTINTVKALRAIGVPAKKIRVVFNGLEPDETIEEVFAPILACGIDSDAEVSGDLYELRRQAVIYYNEAFERIKGSGMNLSDVVADTTDFKALIKVTTDQEERVRLANRLATRRLASSAHDNLDRAFQALTA